MADDEDLLRESTLELFEDAGYQVLSARTGVAASEHAIANKELFELEFPIKRHDGAYRWFLTRATPIKDETGTLVRWVGINTDIHDQVLARRQIQESEEKFRQIVTQVDAGIAQTDLNGRFTLTNERCREIVGRSGAELQNMRMQRCRTSLILTTSAVPAIRHHPHPSRWRSASRACAR